MTFPVDDIYLGPATFGARKATEGIAWHTTEATGFSRAHAIGTANWQKTNPGSYNWIIYDGGLLLTVPYLEASGGLATGGSAWAPERYPWLKRLLSPAAYADPNAYLLNIAFSGRTADILAGRMPGNMLDTAARLTRWVEQQAWGADNQVMTSHSDWQSNRSDPGAGTVDKILARYAALYPAQPNPPPAPDYRALYVAEQAKAAALAARLGTVKRKVAAMAADVAND